MPPKVSYRFLSGFARGPHSNQPVVFERVDDDFEDDEGEFGVVEVTLPPRGTVAVVVFDDDNCAYEPIRLASLGDAIAMAIHLYDFINGTAPCVDDDEMDISKIRKVACPRDVDDDDICAVAAIDDTGRVLWLRGLSTDARWKDKDVKRATPAQAKRASSASMPAKKKSAQEPTEQTTVVLAVVGSRTWTDVAAIESALDAWMDEHGQPARMISGGAKGADTIAKQYAAARNIPFDEYAVTKKEWQEHGGAAGPMRNARMLANATHVVAFSRGDTAGTRNAIQTAGRLGLVVTVIEDKKK